MKRSAAFMICILLMLSLCACGSGDKSFTIPVNFYYCNNEISYNSPTGVICGEVREGANYHDTQALLRAYLQGPVSDELSMWLPAQTALISCDTEGTTAYVQFSEHFAQLSGIRLTTACACVVRTLNEYVGIETVEFSAQNEDLDGKQTIVVRAAEIATMDTVRMKG